MAIVHYLAGGDMDDDNSHDDDMNRDLMDIIENAVDGAGGRGDGGDGDMGGNSLVYMLQHALQGHPVENDLLNAVTR